MLAKFLRLARRLGQISVVFGCFISETLLESELFGHECASFTAVLLPRRREQTNGSAMFFDKIGRMRVERTDFEILNLEICS